MAARRSGGTCTQPVRGCPRWGGRCGSEADAHAAAWLRDGAAQNPPPLLARLPAPSLPPRCRLLLHAGNYGLLPQTWEDPAHKNTECDAAVRGQLPPPLLSVHLLLYHCGGVPCALPASPPCTCLPRTRPCGPNERNTNHTHTLSPDRTVTDLLVFCKFEGTTAHACAAPFAGVFPPACSAALCCMPANADARAPRACRSACLRTAMHGASCPQPLPRAASRPAA